MRQRSPARLVPVRASVLAALATLLTATGHAVGGGSLVDLSPLAVLVPLLVTVLVAVADRCRGVVATLAALGAGQVGLHVLLDVLTPHDHGAAVPPAQMVAAHAVATAVIAVVLARADAAVGALLVALRRVLPRRLHPCPVDLAPPTRPVPDGAVPLLAGLAVLTAHARRGPPLVG